MVQNVGTASKTGTKISFMPDSQIFGDIEFDYQTLQKRVREMAYLNAGLQINFSDDRINKKEIYKFEQGLRAYIRHLNEGKETVHKDIIYFSKDDNEAMMCCEVAMQYHSGYNENVIVFANNIRNIDGGTHLSGFKTALTRTMNYYAKTNNLLKDGQAMTGEDLREGLTAVVSVKLANPHFEAQTKVRLTNPEVGRFVEMVVNEYLGHYLEEHPADSRRVLNKAISALHCAGFFVLPSLHCAGFFVLAFLHCAGFFVLPSLHSADFFVLPSLHCAGLFVLALLHCAGFFVLALLHCADFFVLALLHCADFFVLASLHCAGFFVLADLI